MSRSERYIQPSQQQLEQMQREADEATQLQEKRLNLLRRALNRTPKAKLIETILSLAHDNPSSVWFWEKHVDIDKPMDLLVHDVKIAIMAATKIDDRRLNYNFEYDWRAYEAIHAGLLQLIKLNALEEVKQLALELIRAGSHQIECSDEGEMSVDIETCLRPVIQAVAGTPGAALWATEMRTCDRVGFLCEKELHELAFQR